VWISVVQYYKVYFKVGCLKIHKIVQFHISFIRWESVFFLSAQL